MTTAQFGVILNQPARIAATAAIASIPPITMLLMESTAPVDPIWTLSISDYIVSRPDGIALFAMTAAALAIGQGGSTNPYGVYCNIGYASAPTEIRADGNGTALGDSYLVTDVVGSDWDWHPRSSSN